MRWQLPRLSEISKEEAAVGRKLRKGIYNQLIEVMAHLNSVENDYKQQVKHLNEEIIILKKENQRLQEENQLLRDNNARLKSIINNDSSNTPLLLSTDQKGTKPANTFNGREKNGRRTGRQKGHKGTTLSKYEVEEKLGTAGAGMKSGA